jgi:hypothetical protein
VIELSGGVTPSKAVTWLLTVWRILPQRHVFDIMDSKWTANRHSAHLGEDEERNKPNLYFYLKTKII